MFKDVEETSSPFIRDSADARFLKSRDYIQKGCFSASAGSDYGNELSLLYFEAYVFEDNYVFAFPAEALVNMFYENH